MSRHIVLESTPTATSGQLVTAVTAQPVNSTQHGVSVAGQLVIRFWVVTSWLAANVKHSAVEIKWCKHVVKTTRDVSSIVGLGLGLVVGLGTVLVLFFIAFFPFRCLLKTKNYNHLSASSMAEWYGVCTVLIESRVRGLNAVRAIFYVFFKVLYLSFLLRLVLALRLLLGLGWTLICDICDYLWL